MSGLTLEPHAVARRIVREAWILFGPMPCSILLQIAHPKIAAGVHNHSGFTEAPLERARNTVQFVYAVAFGSEAEAAAVTRAVNAVHRRVRGPGYSADDPDLKLWVAATGFASYVDGHERIFGPFTREEKSAALEDFARWGTVLGLSKHRWPGDPDRFADYWDRALAELEVGPEARTIAWQMFRPRQRWLRPLTATQRFFTTGLLPPRLRAEFGLPWGPRHQRAFDATMAALARVYPRLPLVLRELPKTYYMRDLRRRVHDHGLGPPPRHAGASASSTTPGATSAASR